jgi:LysR family transcriptional regulator, regulator for genes of the gallate degradation pathway
MISRNLRHLWLFLAASELGSLTRASEGACVSQPAVTQALGKLERAAGGPLFDRTRHGVFASERGEVLARRVARALARMDAALREGSPLLPLTASAAQLSARIALADAGNSTLAARSLGLAQPTVHRAVTQLENEAGCALFERRPHGLMPTRALALSQAAGVLGAGTGARRPGRARRSRGRARHRGRAAAGVLGAAAARRELRPKQALRVVDGLHRDLLSGLRHGDIDLLVGALCDAAPIGGAVPAAQSVPEAEPQGRAMAAKAVRQRVRNCADLLRSSATSSGGASAMARRALGRSAVSSGSCA